MRKVEFMKPTLELVDDGGEKTDNYCKLKISPLERGYGQTIGNSLRRVLLSSLPGAAAVAISIEGVEHEFCAVDGIREDVTEIILNMKKVIFTINADKNEEGDFGDESKIYRLELIQNLPTVDEQIHSGVKKEEVVYEKVVRASDINTASDEVIRVVNPDQEICTLAAGGTLKMEIFIRNGVGYVSAQENKVFCKESNNQVIGRLAIDSIFTPVLRCKYEAVKTRFQDNFDCDLLTVEVWTNGSMKAVNAISLAARFLMEHFALVEDLNSQIAQKEYMMQKEEKVTNSKLDRKIEDLNLSVRSYNCLKRATINTVGELTQKTEEEMMKVRNLGRKSLKEVIQKLHEIGLSLKNSTTSFDDLDNDSDDDDTDTSVEDGEYLDNTSENEESTDEEKDEE
jgi:DNA-directed RNA polymerase subunit alpha